MTTPRFRCLGLAAAAGLASIALAASAAESVDRVEAIDVHAAPGGGVVVVHGTRSPVFSVFRLHAPDRIVLDLAGADVSHAGTPAVSGVPGLSGVSAVQFQRGDSRVGRIILDAAADVRYDARVDGRDVVLALTSPAAVPPAPPALAPPAPVAPVSAASPAPAAAARHAEPIDASLVERREDRRDVGTAGHRILAASGSERNGQLVLRIATDGPVANYVLWRLRNPGRVAVDLAGFRAHHARARASGDLKDVRFGAVAAGERVVFDLAQAEPPPVAARRIHGGLELAVGAARPEPVARVRAVPVRSTARAPKLAERSASPAPAAEPAAPAVKTPALRDLRISGDAGGEQIVLELPAEAVASLPQVASEGPGRFQMSLDGVAVPERLQRTLDASAFGGPISTVSAFNLGKAAGRIVVAAAPGVHEVLRRDGRVLVWTFDPPPPTAAAQAAAALAPAPAAAVTTAESSAEVAGFSTAAAEAGTEAVHRPRYTGRRISMEFKDIDIQNLLRLFAEISHRNIVVSDDVKGKVTIALRNVPWDQAFDLILKTHGLGKEEVGNIIRVAPQAVLDKERKEALDALHAKEQLEPLKVRLIPVNYALAGDVADKIKDVLSDRGVVTVDQRTNVLIVKDVVENLAKAEGMVRNLDTQTPEVLIESRIVEAATTFARQLGIQWGGNGGFAPVFGNTTGLVFPSLATIAGAAGDSPNAGTAGAPNFAVNLPAAIGQGAGGGVGFIFGSAGGAFNLNLRLSALENNGLVKTVSAPKVATLDNNEADISQGLSIPFSQVSAAGVQTTFIEARLELKVTPHVTADGSILMKINATNNQPNAGITGANGQPSISRKEAKTQMLVKDGDTTVIGGIYTRQTGVTVNEVPFFGKIPILGWLFKSRSDSDSRTELLIFITPRILNRQQVVSAGAGG